MFNKYGRVRGSRLPLTQSVVLNCGGALSREGRGRINKRCSSRPCRVTVSDAVRLAKRNPPIAKSVAQHASRRPTSPPSARETHTMSPVAPRIPAPLASTTSIANTTCLAAQAGRSPTLWSTIMASYSLILPEDFDEYEWEVTSKGWFGNALLNFSGRVFRLRFFDPVRLSQEIEDELKRGQAFFEPNLIVVRSVTRSEMDRAAELLVRSGQTSSLVSE